MNDLLVDVYYSYNNKIDRQILCNCGWNTAKDYVKRLFEKEKLIARIVVCPNNEYNSPVYTFTGVEDGKLVVC